MIPFSAPTGLEREDRLLAAYAMRSADSRGRQHAEAGDDPYRPAFQRDRERIVHCRAFRRMTSKTQVLAAQTNDHHRTRLTHSLEVAQISRTVARMLGLNEDLVEAVALSHDLGHPPFGHAGEKALNECLSDIGGFDHNLHALRIVDILEHPYPNFAGLNLTWEVRSAFAYHAKRQSEPLAKELMSAGEALLEFQVVDVCDGLAYDTHDLDDALGAEIIRIDDLRETGFWQLAVDRAGERWPAIAGDQFRPVMVRGLIELQVRDLVAETGRRLRQHGVDSVAAVRRTAGLVGFSEHMQAIKLELQEFLRSQVYEHPWVAGMASDGQRAIRGLFAHFSRQPNDLPETHRRRLSDALAARVVGDYIAGMTDRFARKDFARLCGSAGSV